MVEKIVLGTRGSDLARTQAQLVAEAIRTAAPEISIETKIIATPGDKTTIVDPRAGRKGIFTVAIESALLVGEVDVAVHSAKDLPSETNPHAEVAAVLPRAPVDDVLVAKCAGGLACLSEGATVATGSVRRKHQLLWKRAELNVVDLHGNVPTRLRKLAENEWDAILLARAGLERLGFQASRAAISFEGSQFFLEVLPRAIFLPAGGQGTIGLQVRADDEITKQAVSLVNHRQTLLCLQAEREFLRGLQGDCNCPVGVFAEIANGRMKMRAQVFRGDSATPREAEVKGDCDEGNKLAGELLRTITLK